MSYAREQFIAGLRDLAAFLDERPEVPTPAYFTDVQVSAEHEVPAAHGGLHERVEFSAQAMGVSARFTNESRTHYEASVSFGPLRYFVLAITPERMRQCEEEQRLGREAYERLHAEANVDEQERQGREIDAAAETTRHLPGWMPEPAATDDAPEDGCCTESKRLGDACAQCQLGIYAGNRVRVHAPLRYAADRFGTVEFIVRAENRYMVAVALDGTGQRIYCGPRHVTVIPSEAVEVAR